MMAYQKEHVSSSDNGYLLYTKVGNNISGGANVPAS